MTSDEGESYEFVTPVKIEGKVEDWMNKVDEEMRSSLQILLKTAFSIMPNRKESTGSKVRLVRLPLLAPRSGGPSQLRTCSRE